jgi:hypothetical protein
MMHMYQPSTDAPAKVMPVGARHSHILYAGPDLERRNPNPKPV